MGGRCPSQRPARGGGVVQAARQARARIALGALSALAYAGVAVYAAGREPAIAGLAAGLDAVGAVFLALVLVRRHVELLPWPLVCVGAAYAASLFVHGASVDGRAPLVAAGMLLCAELAAWSLDERHAIPAERRVVAARASAVAMLVLAGLGAAAAVVALAAAPGGGGLGWTALGAVSAVVVVGLAARLLAR